VHRATDTLLQSGRNTAENELREVFRDLARRRTPDLTGAVQHAGAALECVARDVTGDPKAGSGLKDAEQRSTVAIIGRRIPRMIYSI
jgi:hypothetical protein